MNIYVRMGLITEEEYQKALSYQQNANVSLQEALIELAFIQEDKVVQYCNSMIVEDMGVR